MSLLHDRAAELPTTSGVYLFKNKRGKVLYVGKAGNLRGRVRQYLTGSDERTMVPFLVSRAHDVEVVVTVTEKEALLLENHLIKEHRPKYNVKLRDDSNFLHLRIDLAERWPRYTLTRYIRNDKAKYFGPYHSASKARQTLAFVGRAFPLRTCTDSVLRSRTRPCLLFQMGRCAAPCVDAVEEAEYGAIARQSTLLLQGRQREALTHLRERMLAHAAALEFERAARLRDLIISIEATLERQNVVDTKLGDRDVWGLFRQGSTGAVAVVPVREGRMGQPTAKVLPAMVGDDAEVLSSLLNSWYAEGSEIPDEVLVPARPADADALEEVMSDRRGRRVTLHVPQRGSKARLVELAEENARVRYLAETDEEARHVRAMRDLADALELAEPPRRMECFDNSNLQGTDPVAAMAVFIDGKPARAEYRRYRVKTVEGADDYASMREILDRRLRRGIDEGNLPDLIVVDGGKGQLKVAMAVLEDLGLHALPVCGISKPRTERKKGDRAATDKIVLPHRKDPLRLSVSHPGLRVLQHLRDETHRSAIRYHRKVRNASNLASALEGIRGVGPRRRVSLLRALGSVEAVAMADVETIAAVPGVGMTVARAIKAAFDRGAL
ncbi:MAG: excinuclease ABC subunit C [Myxococcota bacterium]|jgi:excinuclease ABC subunit C